MSLAILTSGGDAPGMNAVIRAVVRTAIFYQKDVYCICEGYQGLVNGNIIKMELDDISMIIQKGGTIIGSARCNEFRTEEGRLKAANHLVNKNITHLICCGGDGSLTGANIFKNEWNSLLKKLLLLGNITEDQFSSCSVLNLVGLIGSIDNDMIFDGDLSIGVDTAMNRITECIDSVMSTAHSHQRTFVLEVMGRHCGYLAWAAAVTSGADFVFIPECPLVDDWETILCTKLQLRRIKGRRMNLIIIAEGAIDVHGNSIKTEYVSNIIKERLGHDTRSTVLGHVQRGGRPSAYDRFMGTILGTAAVEYIIKSDPNKPAQIIGLKGSNITYSSLVKSVADTQMIMKLTSSLEFEKVMNLRGTNFKQGYEQCIAINRSTPRNFSNDNSEVVSIAIMCVGAPAAGMNSAIRAIVRLGLNMKYQIYGFYYGWEGLENDDFILFDFIIVDEWGHLDTTLGGTKLKTSRSEPKNFDKIAENLKNKNIKGLIIIGGFEGLTSILALKENKNIFKQFQIPTILIPATISNNLPGTDWSIGCDTAMNVIVDSIDRLNFSANSSKKRLFIIETQGKNCGFLAFASALASGSNRAYTPEEGVTLSDLTKDSDLLNAKIKNGKLNHMVFVRNEKCNLTYSVEFMTKLFQEESKKQYSVRNLVLGHLCQGLHPSPLDRIRAVRLAAAGLNFIAKQIAENKNDYAIVGLIEDTLKFTDVAELNCNFKLRVPTEQWFTKFYDYLLDIRQM